mmetsp:Transcript_24991/g.38333  ORF Transcript_24991/g.38333 Transcript_24991/m.38333 type:complete len:207 (-) Transcript_24991:472-1092(-)
MDEGTGLSSGSIDGERNSHGSLHEETVQYGTVVSIVVETVDQTLITDSLGSVGSPYNTLMKISHTKVIILLVKLPQKGIKTLGGMVHRSRVGGVENVLLTSTREDNINVSLGDFTSRCSISIHSHGTKMDNVSINFGINYSTAQVVGSRNVVVDGVTLAFGVFHGVGSGTLFGEVNDGVGLLFFDELDEKIVFLGNVKVDKFDILS